MVAARPLAAKGSRPDENVDKDHRNGPAWLSRLSDRIAKQRDAWRITARKKAIDRALKGLIKSVETFVQEINTANVETAGRHRSNSAPDEPLRFGSAIMEMLATILLVANRDYETINRYREDKTFLKSRDIPCETTASERTEIDPNHL